jgi:hypothetical protein
MIDYIKRLFEGDSGEEGDMNRRYVVQLDSGEHVPAVYIDAHAHPVDVLRLLRFGKLPRPSIFITGGASKMTEEDIKLTRKVFEDAIAPFAEKHQAVVIDGATKSGVIEMMATARLKGNFTFPLIGIAPYEKIQYANKLESGDLHSLSPGHTHFVFVTGKSYGAESEMIVNTAHIVAGGKLDKGGRRSAAIGIVVNGGSITRQEAYMATSKYIDIPLVVLEGSGRFADELASAVRTGETSQALIRSIIDRGNVQLAGTAGGPQGMLDKLEIAFRTDMEANV